MQDAQFRQAMFAAAKIPSALPQAGMADTTRLILSGFGALRAGFDASIYPREEISVRNRDAPIAIRIVADVESVVLDASVGAGQT